MAKVQSTSSKPGKRTLGDVAKAAGVSTSTVSRVVKGDDWVSPQMDQRVKQAMRQVGYQPQQRQARVGNARRPSEICLGLVLSAPAEVWDRYPFFHRVAASVVEAAQVHGGITVVRADGSADSVDRVVQDHGFDAVLVLLPHGDFAAVRSTAKTVPVVWLLGEAPSAIAVDHVGADNEAVGEIAFEWLLNQGCDRFCFVTSNPDRPIIQVRAGGFWKTAARAGHPVQTHAIGGDPQLGPLFGGTITHAPEMKTLAEGLVGLARDADRLGLFFPSDLQVAHCYPSLVKAGLFGHDNVRMISCDKDHSTLLGLDPCPVSIDLNLSAIGSSAIQRLTQRLEDPETPLASIRILPHVPNPSNNSGR
jgi:LacI family transcriptional regulator